MEVGDWGYAPFQVIPFLMKPIIKTIPFDGRSASFKTYKFVDLGI